MIAKLAVLGLLVAGAFAKPQFISEEEAALARGEMFDANPIYAYSYQIADEDEQTYIAKDENRDGENVQGSYSYVDPLGSLVTVTYTADSDGYQEERNVQENFVTIRRSSGGATTIIEPRVQTVQTTTTSNDGLIARIIAQLTPFIRETVSSTIGSTRRTQVVQVQQPAAAASTASVFGTGGPNNVRVETPVYTFNYDI